jgi:hypothetical protein
VTPRTLVRIARPHVVAEEIEGEVIAINLDTGAYFSFRDTASTIWQELLGGDTTVESLTDDLAADHVGEREEIEPAVTSFVRALEAEGLISIAEGGDAALPARDRAEPRGAPTPFVAPVFEKYTDMEEFLLIDPIHEVDPGDWPTVRDRPPL